MLNQSDIEDLQFVMLSLSAGSMTPEGNVSVDGRTISWAFTSGSTTKMEVSVSSRKLVYWSGWEWDSESMKVTWIGIGNHSTQRATVSTSRTLYVRKGGLWTLSSMRLKKGLPIGENSSYSLLDMVREEGFHQN